MTPFEMHPGRPGPPGAHFDGEGTHLRLYSNHAQGVSVCLFDAAGVETQRLSVPERTGALWHGYVSGLRPGALYGYRVDGPFEPQKGHRFNPNKLLTDPYARALSGAYTHHPATFGHNGTDDLSFDTTDSAPFMPKCIVPDPADWPLDARTLGRGWDDALIYEAHLRGATLRHPRIPNDLRGTFDGMASPAMLDHLSRLGVTAVELMPVQAFLSEGALIARGLTNYWGYNTIGFFMPHPGYLGPQGAAGVRAMVDRFHEAGIEVILDVVYNHTAESDHLGPTLSFRGIDNASYYRLQAGDKRYYVNDTGTGNTLDLTQPFVLRMVLDSLRFWVQAFGVDGFRFDLATTLAREAHGFDPKGGFLDALRQDPVLSTVKLIAEPWDVGPGGYRLGQFPPEFAEWNDRYRDTVRRFWRGDAGAAQDLGGALLGSAETFDHMGSRTWASVNFAAAHDGFTLWDTTAYNKKHNAPNGENNRDGHHANFSDNHGVEGATDDPAITAARFGRVRNMLATVLLSQGTPMLLAGDEGGHSQKGMNNAYAQDNAITWLDWAKMDADLIAFTAAVSAYRRAHPVLRQTRFLHSQSRPDGQPDVIWRGFDGEAVAWREPTLAALALEVRGSAECAVGCAMQDVVLLAFNRAPEPRLLRLPPLAGRQWERGLDTSTFSQSPLRIETATVIVPAQSLSAFHAVTP